MSFFKKSLKGFAWNHLAKLSEYGLTYLIGIIFARLLQPSEYGIYVTVMSIASIAIILGAVGFDETLNKIIPQLRVKNELPQLRYIVSKLFKIRFIVLIIFSLLIYIFRFEIEGLLQTKNISSYISSITIFIVAQGLVNFSVNYLIGNLKTKKVFILNLLLKISTLIISTLLLYYNFGLRNIFLYFGIITSTFFLFYFKEIVNSSAGEKLKTELKSIYKFSFATWGNAILGLVLGRYSVLLILGFYFGVTEQSAYFEIAWALTLVIEYLFAVGFVGVSITLFSELAAEKINELADARSKMMKYHQLFIFPVSLFSIIYSTEIISFLYSPKYLPAAELFKIFLSCNLIAVSIFGSGLNAGVLLSIGKQKIVFVNRAIIGAFSLIANILVIPNHGAIGAITVSGISIIITFASEYFIASKYIGSKYDYVFILKVIIVSIVSLTIVRNVGFDSQFKLFISATFYSTLITLGYYLTKIVNREIKEKLFNLISNG